MESREFKNIIVAIIVLFIISSFGFMIEKNWIDVSKTFLFSVVIILVYVFSRKAIAYSLDSDVSHNIWSFSRYGFIPHQKIRPAIPTGLVIPLIISVISLGLIKFPSILTYETKASKYRAAKRFGFYSFTEITEWDNAIIGASSIVSLLILSAISYFFFPVNLEYLSKISAYYALVNLIPLSDLDGTQIFFGSRILWIALSVITLIFAFFAMTI